jgi:hypothetical protein
MKRRKTYVIRNDDEGWTYVGIDDYSKDIPLLSSYARRITPGMNAIDIVMKNYVAGKESPPHFLVGTITLDESKPSKEEQAAIDFADTFINNLLLIKPRSAN